VLGTATVTGTKTNELNGTETTALCGTDWMTDDETEDGTFDEAITTAEGDDGMV